MPRRPNAPADPRTDVALFVLRSAGLGLALAHGLGKVTALADGQSGFVSGVAALGFPAPVAFAWAAALGELVGGLLVAVGLATRWAAAFAAPVLATAAFVRHRAVQQLAIVAGASVADPEAAARWGSPEKALLYLVILVGVMLLGPGRFSLDHALARRRHR